MDDENYDLLPHKEIVGIKKELEDLKNKQTKTDTKNIMYQVTQLKDSINDLLDLFKEAHESFKLEEKEPPYIKEVQHRLNLLSDQNTRIAEGIVAVADMIKELKLKADKQVLEQPPRPIPQNIPRPIEMPPQQNRPLPPGFDIPPPPSFDIPPLPDFSENKQKRGLFGRSRK